jgi:hypothetical protein
VPLHIPAPQRVERLGEKIVAAGGKEGRREVTGVKPISPLVFYIFLIRVVHTTKYIYT